MLNAIHPSQGPGDTRHQDWLLKQLQYKADVNFSLHISFNQLLTIPFDHSHRRRVRDSRKSKHNPTNKLREERKIQQ